MKRFVAKDEGFICNNCGYHVEPLKYSSRDHCPKCLYSVHIDINPGDRSNPCLGSLVPIGIEKFKDTYKIIYKCQKCMETHKNIMARDDNMNVVIELSSKQ